MSPFLAFPEPAQAAGTGVLLVNLGTPDAPDTPSVRRYLAEFLADPRIVEQPRWLWWLILHGVILRVRPARSARAYSEIWTDAGSPLLVHTRALADRVQASVRTRLGSRIRVIHAMRYGSDGIAESLERLGREGIRRLLVLPLFPQYSATTTASVLDAVGAALRRWRRVPDLRFVADYHDQALHIEALARSVEQHWQAHGRAERLLLSFHGIPERYVQSGDPYADQCRATAERLRQRLGVSEGELLVAFQSRVGREPWLQPYTDALIKDLPSQGVRTLDVLCPGFAVDCLETLEEIAIRGRQTFLDAGGAGFAVIPCLNAGEAQVEALSDLIVRQLAGWPDGVEGIRQG